MNYLLFFMSLISTFKNKPSVEMGSKTSKLVFEIKQNIDVYEASMFGEPPQLAIWIENMTTKQVKTVYVTKRTGTGDFEGKLNVPVALPIWVNVFRKETGKSGFPSPATTAPDAVTGASIKQELIYKEIIIATNQTWNYYIEVNVSGDFNKYFSNYQSNGEIDDQANGQPSLIYKGTISSIPGNISKPKLIGRTEQKIYTSLLNPDLDKITTAKMLLKNIEVSCHKIN